jgi:hypothetical protein
MSDAQDLAATAAAKAVEAEIAAHETNFERHKDELLDLLRKVYERSPKTKPFDANNAWRHLRFVAYVYFRREAEVSQKRARMPAGDRAKLLRQLGNALRDARRKADEAMKTVRGYWFVEWAEANGNPDFTDPIIVRFEEEFDKTVAGLAVLETAAFRAAETVRKKRGRPPGTAALPHNFIVSLESVYRDITKGNSGAGPGPFARFVKEFLTALGRECPQQSVIEAIKDAKKREEKHPGD